MAKLEINSRTLGGLFFCSYEGLDTSPVPVRCRKDFALGTLTRVWAYCAMRGEPDFCCARSFADTMLGAGAFDLLLHGVLVYEDQGKHYWSGPDLDFNWLRGPLVADRWSTYIIRRGTEGGPVKIGRTRELNRRVEALQNGNAEALTVLRVIDGDCEGLLHRACKAHRLKGEWFDGSPEFFAVLATALGEG